MIKMEDKTKIESRARLNEKKLAVFFGILGGKWINPV